jgi:hypothetical protein
MHGRVLPDLFGAYLLELPQRRQNPPLGNRQIMVRTVDGAEILRHCRGDPVEPVGQEGFELDFGHGVVGYKKDSYICDQLWRSAL